MSHYQDIQVQPDKEFDLPFLRNKIYTKLHKAIHDLKATDIGVGFPQAKNKLGAVIRIHSNQGRLQTLQRLNWLGGLSGYCQLSEILPVPDTVKGHQTIPRIRQNMSIAKLQKKIAYQKLKGYLKTADDITAYEKQYKAKMFKTGLTNPYLELQSTSTGNKYRLYLKFGSVQQVAISGEFNRFGLSKTATIPIF